MSSTQSIDASEFPIKSVTVFKSNRAEVVRTFALQLKSGENRIEITSLSSSIDTKSARVSGLGGATRLLDVVCTIVQPSTPFQQNETLRQLQIKRSSLLAEKLIIEQESDLLLGYGRSLSGEHVPINQMSEFLKSFRKEKLSSLVASKELDERIHEVDKTILIETSRETKGKSNGKVTVILHAEDDSTVSLRLTYIVSNAKWEPVYDLHASTKETKSVVLHYRAHIVQTTGEDWKETELTLSTTAALTNEIPRLGVYQIKAGDHPFKKFNAPQPPVSLFGSTAPTQAIRGTGGFGAFGAPASAGTLFGAAPSQTQTSDRVFGFGNAQTAPVVSGGLFGMAQPIQPPQFQQMPQYTQQQQSQQQAAFSTVPVASDERFRERERERVERSDPTAQVGVPFPDENTVDEFTGDYSVVDFGPGELPVAIVEGTATIRTSPLSAQFLVQGLANIPSDGEAHTVSIASSLTFDAVVTRVAVPRLRAQVYLQSRVKNVSEYRLLPGSVSIFLDEGYVSKSSIGDVSPGEGFECTLGVDSSVRVSYERTSEIKYEAARAFGEIGKEVTTYNARTTIHNKHPFAITRLILRDALPLVEEDDKTFKVTLKQPDGLLDATGDEQVAIKEDNGGKFKDSKLKRKVKWGNVVNGKGGEKDGKYEWLAPLEAGQEVTLVAEWEVKSARGAKWYEYVARV